MNKLERHTYSDHSESCNVLWVVPYSLGNNDKEKPLCAQYPPPFFFALSLVESAHVELTDEDVEGRAGCHHLSQEGTEAETNGACWVWMQATDLGQTGSEDDLC